MNPPPDQFPPVTPYGVAKVFQLHDSLKIRVTLGRGGVLVQVRNTNLDFLFAVKRLSWISVVFELS